jgi:hypothetical protein
VVPFGFPDQVWDDVEARAAGIDRTMKELDFQRNTRGPELGSSEAERAKSGNKRKPTLKERFALGKQLAETGYKFVILLFATHPGVEVYPESQRHGMMIDRVAVDMGGLILLFRINFDSSHPGQEYSWEVVNEVDGELVSKSSSFQETWENLVNPQTFDSIGTQIVPASQEDAWMEDNTFEGTPAIDVSMFLASNVDSPMLWDHERFKSFWHALPDEVREATSMG